MSTDGNHADLLSVCTEACPMEEGGLAYLFLKKLRLPPGCVPETVDGLLCLSARDGYPTRLFLSEPVVGKGANWNRYQILDRTWHSWSWTGVSPGRPMEVLAQHFRALR